MVRALSFSLKLAVLVAIAWYLAEKQPGQVSLQWWGYRVDTSVGILLLAAGLVAVLAAILYRSWGGIKRTPGDIGRKLKANRQTRGYRALTQGMVAVAAGEAGEAQRWARKADELLDAPPLTMLLSAQAAQLDGDDQAAKRYFTAMLGRDETRFLGLRGLITQALRDGDEPAALEYVRSAHTLRPNTPWVLETLFDLSEQAGDLEGAERVAREAANGKVLPAPEAKRKHAVVLLERARKAQLAGDPSQTLKLVKQAHKAAPDLVPASVLYAGLLVGSGRKGAAARMLEKAWPAAPHPALVAAYGAAAKGNTLLNYCGVGADLIPFVVDRSAAKQGSYLPGSHIPIFAPGKIAEEKPDYVLILPWNLRAEIMSEMAHVTGWGGRFVTAVPTLRIRDGVS